MRSPSVVAFICFFLIAILGVGLDLWTKSLAFEKLAISVPGTDTEGPVLSNTYTFIPGWLDFEAVKNRGAVFGMAQGMRVLFLVVSVGAIGFLVILFLRSGRKWFYQVILGMLLAGVMGNMYDRFMLGYVRDMIHALPGWPHLFPWVFNVADTLLCTGVGLMILHSTFTVKPNPSTPTNEHPAPGR